MQRLHGVAPTSQGAWGLEYHAGGDWIGLYAVAGYEIARHDDGTIHVIRFVTSNDWGYGGFRWNADRTSARSDAALPAGWSTWEYEK